MVREQIDMRTLSHILPVTAFAAGSLIAIANPASASLILSASLYSPFAMPGTTTVVALQGITPPSTATIHGAGYTISFANMPADQGVVRGTVSGLHATPVAGVSGGNPEYLTGDYGSALTTNIAASGNYLSTDLGTITIAFSANQTAFGLLWGSIDPTNSLTLLENGTVVGSVIGTQVEAAASGFVGNGYQGPGGSAYVDIDSSVAFNEVELSSGQISFESAGLVASTEPLATPEPASLALLGAGVVSLALLRRRTVQRADALRS
jgi:hypothetical protein